MGMVWQLYHTKFKRTKLLLGLIYKLICTNENFLLYGITFMLLPEDVAPYWPEYEYQGEAAS